MSYWQTAQGDYLGWRLTIAVQFIPAVILFAGLPFCPETYKSPHFLSSHEHANPWYRPRWLVKKGRIEQARKVLEYLRDPNVSDIPGELASIEASVESYRVTKESWTALFTRPALFARLWRASLLLFMAQMSGSTSIKYYLPKIFIALGLGRQMSLMVGGIESTLKIGCTILEMILVDRVGRRTTLTAGCVIMAIALLVSFPMSDRHLIACVNNLKLRSMEFYLKPTLTMLTAPLIIPALSSFSFIRLDTLLDLAQLLGSMVPRYATSSPLTRLLLNRMPRSSRQTFEPVASTSLHRAVRSDRSSLLRPGQLVWRELVPGHISYSCQPTLRLEL